MSEYALDMTPDGVGDEVNEDFKMALLIAGRVAEQLVQKMGQRAAEAKRESEQRSRDAAEQMEAHRAVARAAAQDVGTDQWWQKSGPDDVARAWEQIRPWKAYDPDLARTTQDLRDGLAARYDVPNPDDLDVHDLYTTIADRDAQTRGAQLGRFGSESVNEAEWRAGQFTRYADELGDLRQDLERRAAQGPGAARPFGEELWVAGQEAVPADEQWLSERAGAVGDLETRARQEAQRATADADRLRDHGQSQDRDAAADYDTPQRREQLRADLTGRGVHPEAVQARVLSDVAQGRPAAEAAKPAKDTVAAPRARGRGRRADRHRETGVGR